MIAVSGNAGSSTPPRGAPGPRTFSARAALAMIYVVMMAVPTLEPVPAAAQISIGGFHFGGGGRYHRGRGYYRSRSHRHSRRRQRDQKEEPVAEEKVPAIPSSPGASPSTPTTPTGPAGPSRPEPRGPNFEPSK